MLYIAIRGFQRDRCMFHAAALTYISVLSIVPVLAFTFSVVKGLGAYDKLVAEVIRPALDQALPKVIDDTTGAAVESSTSLRAAIERILEFVEQTDVSKLGLFGLAVLLWTVVKMLGSVEKSFNEIWGVKSSRSIVRKVTDYLAIVVITPIFLLTTSGVVGALQFPTAVTILEEFHLGPLLDLSLRVAPLLVAWTAFTFLYLCLPNRRMQFSSALVGGIGGGTLWLVLQVLFLGLQIWTARFNQLYAAFAAFPIFLVWIYLSWVTVMFGAELASAHSRAPTYRGSAYVGPIHQAFEEVLALRALTLVAESFLRGGRPWSVPSLSERMHLPETWIDDVVRKLVNAGLLAPLDRDAANGAPGFLPARSLDAIRVSDVLAALRGQRMIDVFPARSAAARRSEKILEGIDELLVNSPLDHTLRELGEEAIRDAGDRRDEAALAAAGVNRGA